MGWYRPHRTHADIGQRDETLAPPLLLGDCGQTVADPLQVEVFAMSCGCPAKGKHDIHECPLDAVFRRHLPTQERWQWCESLSHDQAVELIAAYRRCPRVIQMDASRLSLGTPFCGS